MDIPCMIDDRIMACSQQPPEIAGAWFRQGRPAGNVIMVKNGKSSARRKVGEYPQVWLLCVGKEKYGKDITRLLRAGTVLEQLERSKVAVYPISEFGKFLNGVRAALQETSLLGTVHYVTYHLADFHKMKSLLFCKSTLMTYAT